MAWRSIVGSALGTRWFQAAAVVLACAVAAEAARLPLLAAAGAASCCCPHRTAENACGCPVCAHRRQIESGHSVVESCGAEAHAPVLAPSDSAMLPPQGGVALRSTRTAVAIVVASPPAEPAVDVPTPPPLALV